MVKLQAVKYKVPEGWRWCVKDEYANKVLIDGLKTEQEAMAFIASRITPTSNN
jgi:hypothetical protein